VETDLRASAADLRVVGLSENYRSAQPILDLAGGLFPDKPLLVSTVRRGDPGFGEIQLFQAPTAAGEAGWMGERIRSLLGGTSLTLADDLSRRTLAPADVAVLVRFSGLIAPIRKSLSASASPAPPGGRRLWNEPRYGCSWPRPDGCSASPCLRTWKSPPPCRTGFWPRGPWAWPPIWATSRPLTGCSGRDRNFVT
jgi:hypothetical protein